MMEMEKPRITCEETDGGQYARFVVEPLEKGYGITLGNCMRRTLLSSLPGSAVIAFRIAGVAHEFSTIRGVAEDVVISVYNAKVYRTGGDKFHQGTGRFSGIVVIAAHIGKTAYILGVGIDCDDRNAAANQLI